MIAYVNGHKKKNGYLKDATFMKQFHILQQMGGGETV